MPKQNDSEKEEIEFQKGIRSTEWFKEYVKEYKLYTITYPKAGYLNKYFCRLLIYWGCIKFLLYLLYDKAEEKSM